ncbi:MAG: hypothetical protein EXS64_15390 [Candidatus Latescibacteria bacterium]|nr:hypothetical protein [Candidatus Latescibacterota bacterium]
MTTVLFRLRTMGYNIQTEGREIIYRWQGLGKPDPASVLPLLEEMRLRKAEALAVLEDVEERSAIIEYEAGLPSLEAEALAWEGVSERRRP